MTSEAIVKTIPGVTEVLETRQRDGKIERLYRCANGYGLGAEKDGPLTHGDEERPWMIFVLVPEGYVNGGTAGWLTEEQVDAVAAKLAAWAENDSTEQAS